MEAWAHALFTIKNFSQTRLADHAKKRHQSLLCLLCWLLLPPCHPVTHEAGGHYYRPSAGLTPVRRVVVRESRGSAGKRSPAASTGPPAPAHLMALLSFS